LGVNLFELTALVQGLSGSDNLGFSLGGGSGSEVSIYNDNSEFGSGAPFSSLSFYVFWGQNEE